MKNQPTKRLALAAFAAAGAMSLFAAAGCQDVQDEAAATARETGQSIQTRLDARTASAENKLDQKQAEASEQVDSAIDRGLDKALGDN